MFPLFGWRHKNFPAAFLFKNMEVWNSRNYWRNKQAENICEFWGNYERRRKPSE